MTHEYQPHQQPGVELDEAAAPETESSFETEPQLRPEIWVGSLADYNNGDLHGGWMDAARPPGEIHDDIQRILASGPAARRGEAPEEWGIFDYDGFGAIEIGEYESIDRVAGIARAIAEHGPAFAAWAAPTPPDDISAEQFEHAYLGRFDSLAEFAAQFAENIGIEQYLDDLIPANLRGYIRFDTDQFGRDLQLAGDISTAPAEGGAIYIYRNF